MGPPGKPNIPIYELCVDAAQETIVSGFTSLHRHLRLNHGSPDTAPETLSACSLPGCTYKAVRAPCT